MLGLFLRYPARVELLTTDEPRMALASATVALLTLALPTLAVGSPKQWASPAFMLALGWLAYIALLSPTLGLMSHGIPMLAADRSVSK